MPRFFVEDGAGSGGEITITGADAHHIARSLRMAVGDEVIVCDTRRREYRCEIRRITDGAVVACVISERDAMSEPPYRAVIYQSLPKGDKMDVIVQKSVECGASEIVPVLSERCVVRPDAKSAERKLARWRRIAEEAAKQCGRAEVPVVSDIIPFAEAIERAALADIPLFCYEGDGVKQIRDVLCAATHESGSEVAVVIGPEGGFSIDEAAGAMGRGLISTGLGPRILRTETAAGFALACLYYELDRAILRDTNKTEGANPL